MIYVTENGVSEKMLCTDLCDDWRMKYFKDYINEMLKGGTTTPAKASPSKKKRKTTGLNMSAVCFVQQRSRTG